MVKNHTPPIHTNVRPKDWHTVAEETGDRREERGDRDRRKEKGDRRDETGERR